MSCFWVPRQFVYGHFVYDISSTTFRLQTFRLRHFVYDISSTDISSTTFRLQTFRLQTFRLLLYTSVHDSYTSNFCFSKSLISSIPTSTYTMIPFYQSHFHFHYDNTTYIVCKYCGMTIQLVLSVIEAYFYQSHF